MQSKILNTNRDEAFRSVDNRFENKEDEENRMKREQESTMAENMRR